MTVFEKGWYSSPLQPPVVNISSLTTTLLSLSIINRSSDEGKEEKRERNAKGKEER